MCGILGQVTNNLDKIHFENSLKKIGYRGPDYSGFYQYKNVLLGHNRLAILDLDARSNQPFDYEGKYTIVFNGEIYNFKEIKKELLSDGYKFRTESDTEVVLASYDKWGYDSFHRFHGMFAFAILDQTNETIVLGRDRFGEKPLFFSEGNGREFVFGSELKAILGLLPKKPDLDYTSLIDFLHFGFVPNPKTIYNSVFKLRPGYFLVYSLRDSRIQANQPYYRVSFNPDSTLSLREKMEHFREIGNRVASQITLSDVSLGSFLSGGVDSSGAVTFLKNREQKINTFTISFDSEHHDESEYAEAVARHLNVANIKRTVSYNDFEKTYGNMVELYDEPFNDFSFVPTYYVCKEAKRHHTVMISGDGADEIFCGYPRYHKIKIFDRFRHLKPLPALLAKAFSLLPEHSNLRRQAILLGREDADFFLYLLSLNFSPDMVDDIYGPVLKKTALQYSPASIIQNYLSELDSDEPLIQKLRYLDIKMTLTDDMLVKVDRASMINSLEVRPFYLHPLVTDFAFRLTPDELVSGHVDKFFLKKTFETMLPKSILYRKKMGFTFPLKDMILSDLKTLFTSSIRHLPGDLINSRSIDKIVTLHQKGDRNYVAQLHSLMFLGAWLKKEGLSEN